MMHARPTRSLEIPKFCAKELLGLTWLAPDGKGTHTTLLIIANSKILRVLTQSWLGYLQKTQQ